MYLRIMMYLVKMQHCMIQTQVILVKFQSQSGTTIPDHYTDN